MSGTAKLRELFTERGYRDRGEITSTELMTLALEAGLVSLEYAGKVAAGANITVNHEGDRP